MKPEKKNIGILTSHFSWDGGVDFLVFLSRGIAENHNHAIYLLVNYSSVNFIKFLILKFKYIFKSPLKFIKNREWELYERKITAAFFNNNIPFEKVYYFHFQFWLSDAIRRKNIEVVLPTMKAFDKSFNWIGYIPDLQHKYFPEWFSKSEKKLRDELYEGLLRESKLLIVNSITVKKDLIKYYNCSGENIFSIPFIPMVTGEVPVSGLSVLKKYGITHPYFIISNQFWKHKNHLVAFKGFIEFCALTNETYELICTGNTNDERFPDYFSQLENYINNSTYKEYIKILGFISKDDQVALLKNSYALIQPTLFEGGPGGGSVYNALAIGKTCVVSDIPINKEINSEQVVFFESQSPESLAKALMKITTIVLPEPDFQEMKKKNDAQLKEVMDVILKKAVL